MSANQKSFRIDSERLKKAIAERGLSLSEASRRIGASGNYLSVCIYSGKISAVHAVALEAVTGIRREEYTVVEPIKGVETEQAQAVSVEPIDYDRLYQIIYGAVYEAVKRAWEE